VLASTAADPSARELADALARKGIAAVRISDAQITDAALIAAQWIAHLRNDERFPTVSVFADAPASEPLIIAARAARADGVVTRVTPAVVGAAPSELSRVIARTLALPATTTRVGDAADAISEFAKTVPTLGRRGTRAERPDTKRGSPRRVLLTTIGPAANPVRIGIEWGSPQKRGRQIWGALVPYGNIWMPGADEATTLTTNAPIALGDLTIPAGDHTFYTFPTAERFDLIVSKDVGQFHTVRNTQLELGRVPMTLMTRADSVEGLTFAIDVSPAGATLRLIWDEREYSAPLRAAGPASLGSPRPR
jgi:hypothetical protein